MKDVDFSKKDNHTEFSGNWLYFSTKSNAVKKQARSDRSYNLLTTKSNGNLLLIKKGGNAPFSLKYNLLFSQYEIIKI